MGGWNAPFHVAAGRSPSSLDPGSLGIGAADPAWPSCPLILTLVFAAPFWLLQQPAQGLAGADRRLRPVQPARRRRDRRAAPTSASTGSSGLLWFLGKTYAFVFMFVLDARHAAARPDRPADGLRLEVAAAGVAAQPLRDRRRDRRRRSSARGSPMSFDPRPRHRQGHGPDPAPLLRAQGHHPVPGGPAATCRRSSAAGCSCSTTSTARSSARPASSAPRPARSSASTWAASTPRAASTSTGARPRRTASGARSRRCGGPAGPCRTRPTSRSRAIDLAPVDAILEDARPRSGPAARDPRGDPGRLRLPAGRGAQADQPPDRCLVRDDLRHGHLLRHLRFEPARRRPSQAARGATAHRPVRGDLPDALDSALSGARRRSRQGGTPGPAVRARRGTPGSPACA